MSSGEEEVFEETTSKKRTVSFEEQDDDSGSKKDRDSRDSSKKYGTSSYSYRTRRTFPGSHLTEGYHSIIRDKSPLRHKDDAGGKSHQTKEEFIYRDVKDLRKKLADLEDKVAKQPSSEDGKCGDFCFSAVRTSFLQAQHGGTVVDYDKVYSNDGNHFSKITGKFRCPLSGLYFFSMHAENACEAASFDLMVDNNPVVSVTQGGENWSTSGNSVIIPLTVGQQVHVFLHHGKMSSYPDKPLATFCGYFVK